MRTNLARCVLAVLTAVVLSGCYSGGQWTMPWKSSPFQSSQNATPGAIGSPVRPSGIAANSKGGNTTTPAAGYASTGSAATMPPVASTGTPAGYTTPSTGYPTAQYPYPTTASGAATPSTPPSGYSPAYTASTAGVPGVGAYGTPAAGASSYGPAPAMSSGSSIPAYQGQAAVPYGPTSSNAAVGAPGGYAQTTASATDYKNPVRPATSYPSSSSTGGANRSSASYGTDRYSTPAASSSQGYGAGGGSGYGADSRARYGETTTNTSGPSGTDAAAPSSDRYAAPGASLAPPLTDSRYATPSTTGGSGYVPPASYSPTGAGYSAPASSGSAAPVDNRYAPPGGFSAPPASGSSDPSAYRPGSTTDYVPRRTNATSPSTLSSSPAAPSSVTPASYTMPATGAGM